MFRLEQKVAFVTGGGSGIGEAIARTFAAVGADVVVADRDTRAGERIAQELGALFVELDVSDENSYATVAARVLNEKGRVDVLANVAGIGHVGTLLECNADDLDRLYAVNVRGVFNGCKQFLPGMIEQGGGAIVNMASIGGITGVRDRLAYCTTKFAVVGLTKAIAIDHAHQGVRANCICPARVETPFVQARLAEYSDPEQARRDMSATQPVGRMGRPEEIAAAALYLASDEASFVTGEALVIDGGWNAGR
ncbi:MAG: 2-keto-3-deoxy-L-fuconate dehydrogenase [Abditibacteriota bacterium]|nr:2-keto-3-deoxy-L-fuconate dehydrogenase [Abditibacteriota bacterium]